MPVKEDVQVESHHDKAHVLHEEGAGQDQENAVLVGGFGLDRRLVNSVIVGSAAACSILVTSVRSVWPAG